MRTGLLTESTEAINDDTIITTGVCQYRVRVSFPPQNSNLYLKASTSIMGKQLQKLSKECE